ncbi:MAG: DUF4317 family protein, partial [Firmicutes bacterium]|nr:DUF4317 family protein [Bacillota bacterium]
PELGYAPFEQSFKKHSATQLVGAPELGFMFPAFDDRSANLYGALFYSKDSTTMNHDFLESVFHAEDMPLAAGEQKAAFQDVLETSLEESCRFDVVQDLHAHLRNRIMLHKESKDPETLHISSREVCDVLQHSGVSEEKVTAFKEKCDEHFGEGSELNPGNIIESHKFQIVTPNVKISVDPEYTYMVQTRTINGQKYIVIPANEGVEVNGLYVEIPDHSGKEE